MPSLLLIAPWIGSVAVAAVAAATDLRSGRIPNALTYPALLIGPPCNALLFGRAGFFDAACGVLLAGLVPALLHARGAIGGGDVKLFAALGGWLGVSAALQVQCWSMCFAALQGLVIAGWHRNRPREVRMGGAVLLGCLMVALDATGVTP